MNYRANRLKETIKNSSMWKKIEEKLKSIGYSLSDNIIELFVYVIDVDGPEKLSAIQKEYQILLDFADLNFKDYKEIYDNLEGFLKKVLFITSITEYDSYMRNKNGSLSQLCNKMGLKDFDRKNNAKIDEFIKIIDSTFNLRNDSSHNAYERLRSIDDEILWKPLLVEIWSIIKFQDKIKDSKNSFTKDILDEFAIKYCSYQKNKYIEEGFNYIQIEYENIVNPDEYNESVPSEIIKGTADTLMKTINFEKTPNIKLIAPAGMGKTKMLEYLNYKFSNEIEKKESRIYPILIYCNDATGDLINYSFTDTLYNKILSFLEFIGREDISGEVLINHISKNYKILYLIDGLNEVNKSNRDKNRFINSLQDYINKNKNAYFLMTERYSKGSITINKNIVYYKMSDITEEIKMKFFESKGKEKLYERIKIIKNTYNIAIQKEMNELLTTPFYLSIICEIIDSSGTENDINYPKSKQELMDLFIRELVERERTKGETTANYVYLKYYLMGLADVIDANNKASHETVLEVFTEITKKLGLTPNDYSSDHIIELLQQLGVISHLKDNSILVNEIYAEYIVELNLINTL